MPSLTNIKPAAGSKHKSKRIGRGNGSGHGTFSTKGCKGQKARSGGSIPPSFEGGQTPLARRLPKLKGFTNPGKTSFQIVNTGLLNGKFEDGDTVNMETLFEKRLIRSKTLPVKILGMGDLAKKLTVKIDRVAGSARVKIESAKGSVEELLPANTAQKS
jgi:large subunit ribosomal protein L15